MLDKVSSREYEKMKQNDPPFRSPLFFFKKENINNNSKIIGYDFQWKNVLCPIQQKGVSE